jgi:hypothetical protein
VASACKFQCKHAPGWGLQLDGLVSIGAHEIVEWITDPDGDAWYGLYMNVPENHETCQ